MMKKSEADGLQLTSHSDLLLWNFSLIQICSNDAEDTKSKNKNDVVEIKYKKCVCEPEMGWVYKLAELKAKQQAVVTRSLLLT